MDKNKNHSIKEGIKSYITPDMPQYNKLKYKIGDSNGKIAITAIFKTRVNGTSKIFVETICKCTKTRDMEIFNFGIYKSCGCTLGHVTHNLSKDNIELVSAWHTMVKRCYNPSDERFKNYGARGIKPIDWWYNEQEPSEILIPRFVYWAKNNGHKKGLEIDRIDVNSGYSPWNCRWVTPQEQARNKSNHIWIKAWGESKLACQWVNDPRCKTSARNIYERVKRNWKPELAISTETEKQIGKN